MLVSLVLVVAIVVTGIGLTYWMSRQLRPEERVSIGVVAGVLAVSLTMFVAFEAFGIGWGALGVGLGGPGCAAAVAFARHRSSVHSDAVALLHRLRLPSSQPASLRPLAIVSAVSLAVTTRILSLSYQKTPTGVSVGSLAVWGDWSAHLAYAGSFAYGDNRVLDLPIASGQGFRYHFLADFFGSMFTVTGASLPQSLVISEWLLAASLPPLLWCAVVRLSRSRLTAFLTLILFVLSGGIGLWYFASDVDKGGWRIVSSLPRTYARIPDVHLWVDNTISASLYAQRSTLLGLCTGFGALILLLASRPRWERRGFVAAGVLIGAMGLAHVHMLLSALVLAVVAIVVDRRATWWWFIAPAAAIGLPVAWLVRPETSSVRWLLGWMAEGADQAWPWFWFRNVGLLAPLFLALSLLGGVPRRLRRLTMPLWLWFIIPNLIAFHPSEWNNTKFFLFWQFGGCLLIASWLSGAFAHSRQRVGRWRRVALQGAAVVCVLLMVSAGSLDTLRAMERSTSIAWVSDDDLAAARWLRHNSRPGDVIVYGASNTSAVAALGGRRAVTGYTGWTYDLGLPDWAERWEATRAILSGAADASDEIRRYGVDFVVIGPEERANFAASDSYWRQHGTAVFQRGDYVIYRTP